jgi:O-antigen/teichoic acid export membrane protein
VQSRESFEERAGKAARSNLLLSPVIAVVGFASSVIVVRVLTPEAFALYALAIALRGALQFLADMGFGGASTRAFAQLHEHGARAQAKRLFLQLAAVRSSIVIALAVAVVLIPDAFSDVLNLQSDEDYFLAFVVVIGFLEVAAGLGVYVLAGTLAHSVLNKVVLVQSLVQPALVIAAAVAGLGVRGILGAIVLGSLIRAVGLSLASVHAIRRMSDTARGITGLTAGYTRVASASVVGKVAAWVNSRQVVTPIVFSAVSRTQVSVFSATYDWVHQLLAVVSGPVNSLLLPVFSGRRNDEAFTRSFFQFATRSLALVVFPAAAVLVAVFPSMAAVILPSAYAADQADATRFGMIFIPCVALEVVLAAPTTALMLADERLSGAYRTVKLGTAPLALVYVATAGINLLVVAAFMMGIRIASTFALHAALQKRARLHIDIRWFVRALVAAAITATSAAGVTLVVPGRLPDLAVAPLVGLATFLVLVRVCRLLHETDAALAVRVLPFGRRPLRLLTHA